ncbi:MAG: GTPase [Terriglobia bacterium]|jgi:uncharacterized protein (DUF697 family)/GTP-binding protein EngB required for normal cell division
MATAIPNMELANLVTQKLKEVTEERGRVTILVAGRTGVGKSTLINEVFQGQFAKTGQGRPVTKDTREITKEGVPLSIIDTRGMEMADFNTTLRELETRIKERNNLSDPKLHIHVAWVCIMEDSRRVEQAESDLVKVLAKHFPVAVVITKSRSDDGFKAEVQRLLPDAKNVVRVRALPEHFDDGHSLEPMGLVELVQLTNELVPEGQRNALAAAQKVDIGSKVARAHVALGTAATLAAGVGVAPIPFSDAALLVPIQIGALAKITSVFGLPLSTGFLTTLVSGAAGCTGATFVGRALVANALKLIPGAGSIAGGAISAVTAAMLTMALGEAYIAVLARLCKEKPVGEITETEIAEAFKRQLKAV